MKSCECTQILQIFIDTKSFKNAKATKNTHTKHALKDWSWYTYNIYKSCVYLGSLHINTNYENMKQFHKRIIHQWLHPMALFFKEINKSQLALTQLLLDQSLERVKQWFLRVKYCSANNSHFCYAVHTSLSHDLLFVNYSLHLHSLWRKTGGWAEWTSGVRVVMTKKMKRNDAMVVVRSVKKKTNLKGLW